MRKRKFLGVQELTFEIANSCAQLWILNSVIAAAAIGFVGYDRMFQPGKMNADLVCSASFQFHIQQCETLERTSNSVECQSAAASAHDSHARTVPAIAREWLIDFSG